MDYNCLPECLAETRQLLFTEGHVNNNFAILENFEKEFKKWFFVERAVYNFCDQSESVIKKLEEELEKVTPDFGLLESLVNQIRKYSVCIGANHVLTKANQLKECVLERTSVLEGANTQSCRNALREVKLECERFETKMDEYFMMFWHIRPYDINDVVSDSDEDFM